jgi:hypothetical protein
MTLEVCFREGFAEDGRLFLRHCRKELGITEVDRGWKVYRYLIEEE